MSVVTQDNSLTIRPVAEGIMERAPRRLAEGAEWAAARQLSTTYSRFVGAMKFLLPFIALVLIGVVLTWPHLNPSEKRFRVGFSSLAATEAMDLEMVNPRLVGFDSQDQPFSLTADLAKNITPSADFWETADPVEFEMPKADMILEDDTWVVLTAESGVLLPPDRTLELMGEVNLYHDSGYEFETSRAMIDLANSIASGDEIVDGHGPFGHITAEGFRLEKRGGRIHFTGKSSLTLYPGVTRQDPQ